MEPAHIDWKTLDSRFVLDDLYEHIDAPMFIDFSSPPSSTDSLLPDSWFCTSNCSHSKTLSQDLNPSAFSPHKVRFSKSHSVSEFIPSQRTIQRGGGSRRPDLKAKQNAIVIEEDENRNPNFQQMSNRSGNPKEEGIKVEEDVESSPTPWLKRNVSSRNLYAGGDIVNQITYFCRRELKKLTSRTKGVGGSEKRVKNPAKNLNLKQITSQKETGLTPEPSPYSMYGMINRDLKVDDAENTPPPLNVENQRVEDLFYKVRTLPPTPQNIFTSSACDQLNQIFTTPERGILKEKRERGVMKEEVEGKRCHGGKTTGKGTGPFDMLLGVLKPCALSE